YSFLTVEKDRNRPVIYELDLHHRLEFTRRERIYLLGGLPHEIVVERLSVVRRSRLNIRRTSAASRISVKCELRDDEHSAVSFKGGQVHLPGVIIKDAKVDDLLEDIVGSGGRIIS